VSGLQLQLTRWRQLFLAGVRRHRFLTSRLLTRRMLPEFLIIGAQRCGTTSLYEYLCQHPGVAPASVKEVHFFDINYHRGLNWYKGHFPSSLHCRVVSAVRGRTIITGEASPYYLFHPHAPGRIRDTLPGVRLIAVLRNPVDRAYSHFHHALARGEESLSFEEALDREAARLAPEREKLLQDPTYHSPSYQNHSYLARGMYADQLKTWFNQFPREQLLILNFEETMRHWAEASARLLEFMGLPQWRPRAFPRTNATASAPMDGALRRRLCDFFAPHNERLFAMLGVTWNWDR
jgi:hypothetical protein